MKTIRIKQSVKDKLDAFADGKSSNKALRELLEDVDVVEDVIECKPQYINIAIGEDVLVKLKMCKKYSSESHSDVIERLLRDKGL